MAAVGDMPARVAVASAVPAAPPVDNAAYLSTFPDTHTVTPVTMAYASNPTDTPPQSERIFRSLFQVSGERAQPVSPTVRELWGNSSSLTSAASATPVASATSVAPAAPSFPRAPEVRAPQPLDLFSDRAGIFSS
jgi:hypothetical protein